MVCSIPVRLGWRQGTGWCWRRRSSGNDHEHEPRQGQQQDEEPTHPINMGPNRSDGTRLGSISGPAPLSFLSFTSGMGAF